SSIPSSLSSLPIAFSVSYIPSPRCAGIKWKCVNRRQIPAEGGKDWACTELQCQTGVHGTLKHSFHWDYDCDPPAMVSTVDAAEVEDAPRRAEGYEKV
ncbi:unnamed protein product, partial [Prorocentrum cordatum]